MTRRRALWALGLGSLALFAVLAVLDGRMQDAGGHGIVAFELAGSPADAAEILRDWGAEGRDAARASLWLDYAYLATYGAFLWLALRSPGLGRFPRAVAPLALLAAACDAIEDALLLLVLGGTRGAAPALATAFAVAKFAALAVALASLLGGLLARARGRASEARA